ncbi:hypothetical protein [Variovorax sp. KK3]|uniref:hypothetical protein n=1 Tax=Variovorax sp. KK3 TaxID=1855728 RepID=UPI00097CAEBC|nr:hypothetical protein [Variovorax sp. KK3]
MNYEVDHFPICMRSGGAIAVRWGVHGAYKVLVYDGGSLECCREVAIHIQFRWCTTHVDHVVCSRSDLSRTHGLEALFERFSIGALWMHRPWVHANRTLPPEVQAAFRIELLAQTRDVPIHEPYAGTRIGPFTVLSPHRTWYMDHLLPAFSRLRPLLGGLKPAALAQWARLDCARLGQRWDWEPLPRASDAHPREESTAVLYGEFGRRGVLLTGDAGIRALHHACDFAEHFQLDIPRNLRLLQVPGQGKPSHLSSRVLDRLVGRPLPRDQRDDPTRTAFIAAPAGAPPFGYRVVTDALRRRGFKCMLAEGQRLHHGFHMPDRKRSPVARFMARR